MLGIISNKKIIFIIICLIFTCHANADSWIDPTWKRMLDSSDVIALIQYTSNGDFRAGAKILTVYKGSLSAGDDIWISGFNNRYGPIDKMSKGDKYLVFLNFNQPDENGIKYWKEELKVDVKLKDFLEGYKNKKAYYVWSPTSGDLKVNGQKVQYDLVQTSFYGQQNYYSLSEFENFIIAYNDKSRAIDLCKKLVAGIKPATENDLSSQNIMMLFLLRFDRYDSIYKDYVKVRNPSSKYALAQLMGNIKSAESRDILILLLGDTHSVVQGEAVRQLKYESAEIVAPIFLKHLKTSSDVNFGDSNIMDPVRNEIDGGKVEIIKTLGELKYTAAIPDLLLLLDTKNENLFRIVIKALKDIGSKGYIAYINKHLDNKTHELIFNISMMIAEDSLAECLPSFKNFISTCNRELHPSYEYTISTCCGIGSFNDNSTISFLLSDYKNFFTYKDTLSSDKQKYWTKEYIETFTDLKVKEARALIFKSIFDWFGVNEDFGKSPKLFGLKKQQEDSLKASFSSNNSLKKMKMNYCTAFIENTGEIIFGSKPKLSFLIEVSVPATNNGTEYQETVMKEMGLPRESVHIRYENGWYFIEKQDRFDKGISSTPLENFLGYASAIPDKSDINFLQALLDNNFIEDSYYRKKTKETIEEIKTQLK